MLAKLKDRHIIYAYEQPAEKSVIKITNSASKVISWQDDPTDINLSDLGGTSGVSYPQPSTLKYMTYFSRHGNDFQVQQKYLINGVWIPNPAPGYTIDSLDEYGNITQVTVNPTSAAGVTETRFIIV